nr:MAG TPA: Polyomavirus agnoprotein [Caudoviricetes sp.]
MVLNHLLRMMIKMGKDWTGNKDGLFRVIQS